DGDYYGPTVNRCARIRALAKGGQVLVSSVTAKLTQAQLPPGGVLKDLGTHQLKDLSAPERMYQFTHSQMPSIHVTDAQPSETVPAMVSHRAYVVTDHLNRSAEGRQWGAANRYLVTGLEQPITC